MVLNGNYALEAGFSVGKDALAYEKSDSEAAKTYVNVIAVKEGNENSDKIKALVDSNNAEIKDEVLANEICFDTIKGYNKEWNINGETVVIGVEKENA